MRGGFLLRSVAVGSLVGGPGAVDSSGEGGLSPEGVLLVSDQAHGTAGFEEGCCRHHGKSVRPPQRPELKPEAAFLGWHGRKVFKGAARHLA